MLINSVISDGCDGWAFPSPPHARFETYESLHSSRASQK